MRGFRLLLCYSQTAARYNSVNNNNNNLIMLNKYLVETEVQSPAETHPLSHVMHLMLNKQNCLPAKHQIEVNTHTLRQQNHTSLWSC